MNLYMISLGGKVSGANIEVHDVQFAAADQIADTIDMVKANWYGLEEKLHMDSYTKIIGADGYEVKLVKEKTGENTRKLFFVHLGGYQKDMTQELHQVALLTAETAKEAKHRALEEMDLFEVQGHVDQVVDVEACLLQREGETFFIELNESEKEYDLSPDWFGYKRLDIV